MPKFPVSSTSTMAATWTCPTITSTSSSSSSSLRKTLHFTPSKPPFLHPFLKPPSFTLTLTHSAAVVCRSSATPTSSNLSVAAPQTLKSLLKNGETLYGLFLLSFSPTLAEIAGLAGYDFVVVDMEHGHGGVSDALPCLHALAATSTPAVLRLPESSAAWTKKALDLGPQGIMFPMIDSPKSAKQAVSYCRFPPAGVRGSAHTVVRASDYGIDAAYLTNHEEELLIMCQVESEDGVEKIEDIAAVDGVDCIQMGPLDLSASMGFLWDPGNKKVREVMRRAEKAVLGTKGGDGGAYLSGFSMPHDSPDDLRSRGYHMVSGAVDIGLFSSAAVEDVKKFKMSLTAVSDDDEIIEEAKEGAGKYWSE